MKHLPVIRRCEGKVRYHRLRRRLTGARREKRHERCKVVMRDAAGKRRHVVPAVVDADDQLVFVQAVADPAEIRAPLPAVLWMDMRRARGLLARASATACSSSRCS